jgi:hypothetical protein
MMQGVPDQAEVVTMMMIEYSLDMATSAFVLDANGYDRVIRSIIF